MEDKYNNGKPMEIPEDVEERSLAIKSWAENNEHLENAIRSCIDNKIPTCSSCGGENVFDTPYLSMIVNKENLGRIINIMNSVLDVNKTIILLSYLENQGTVLTVHTNWLHKNAVFDRISESAKKEIDSQETNPIVEELLNMHKILRIHAQQHSLEFEQNRFSNRLLIRPYSKSFSEEVLNKMNLKVQELDSWQSVYKKRFSNLDKLKKFFLNMAELVEDTFYKYTDDELFEQEERTEKSKLKADIEFDIKPVNLEELNTNKQEKDFEFGKNEAE